VTKLLGGKSLVYNELCIFVSLFSWQVKSNNVGIVIFGFIDINTLVWLVFCCA
jgi:hypothetical protein